MTTSLALLALLAPAITSAAAFARTVPEPTPFASSTDVWSPAPTAAAQLPLGLFKRQGSGDEYTCGYVSGSSASPIMCPNPTQTCATNTYYGAHGCCDPFSNSACTLATSCIASAALPASCTDSACSSDAAIAKCTASTAPACYEWHFIYARLTFTQYGCAETAFTSTAYHSPGMTTSSSLSEGIETAAPTVPKEPVATLTDSASSSQDSKPNLGAIIGGAIGACVFVAGLTAAAMMLWRGSKRERPPTQLHTYYDSSTGTYREYSSSATATASTYKGEQKGGSEGPWHTNGAESGNGNENGNGGPVEVEARERPVEAPT